MVWVDACRAVGRHESGGLSSGKLAKKAVNPLSNEPGNAEDRLRLPGAGNAIAHLSIYQTYDDVVAIFLDNGVLAYGSNKRWTFHPDGSKRYDSLNQEVHRNYHADTLTQEQFAQLGIPLPDVEKFRGVTRD